MCSKTILVCIQAFFVQAAFSQCWGGTEYGSTAFRPYNGLATAYAFDGIGGRCSNGVYPSVLSAVEFTPTTGGGLAVTSGSTVPPSGISIVSDNAYDGVLAVAGGLPFVGTTGLEGAIPSTGAGAINHSCGNGFNVLTASSLVSSPASVAISDFPAPYGVPAFAPGLAAPGYIAPGLTRPGFLAPGATSLGYSTIPYVTPMLPCDEDFLEAPYDIEFTATEGGDLPISSGSAVPPTGLAIASETYYEGTLAAMGELPFVGSIGVEGVLPTAGVGAVNHHCGEGINAMVSDNIAFGPGYPGVPFTPAGAFAPATPLATGYGYRSWGGRGCECGL